MPLPKSLKLLLKLGSLQLRHKGYKGSMKGKEVETGKLVFRPAFFLFHIHVSSIKIHVCNYLRKGKGKVAAAAGMPQCPPAGSNPTTAWAHPKAQGQWVHAVLWLPFAPGAQPTGPPPPWIFAAPPPAPPRPREESSESSEDRRQFVGFRTVNMLKILHARRTQKMTRKEPTRDDLKLLRKQAARCLLPKTYTNQFISAVSCLQVITTVPSQRHRLGICATLVLWLA